MFNYGYIMKKVKLYYLNRGWISNPVYNKSKSDINEFVHMNRRRNKPFIHVMFSILIDIL
jgi:hypothetical protein